MANYERTEIRKDENAISFSKEWKDKQGLTNRVEVREVKGGYIIRKCKYGSIGNGEKSEYIDESSEEVTTDNPIDKLKDGKIDDKGKEILAALSELGTEEGLIQGY